MKKLEFGGTMEALASLKDGIKPKAGDLLKSTKETLNNTATAVISGIANMKENFIKNPESRKEALGMASAAVLAYLLTPYLNKDAGKQSKSEKKDEPDTNEFQRGIQLAAIPPKAASAEVVTAMFTNAKTLDELYEKYKKTKDPSEIKQFLTMAIIAKESGLNTPPHIAARQINVQAISPDNASGKFLKEKGIEWKIPGGSGFLISDEKYLASLDAFKERIASQLQPGVSEPARTNNAAEILIRCAVGKGQILPVHFISGIKEASGDEKMRMVYEFIRSGNKQSDTTARIVENYGKKYDWNPACISAAYYGGERAGDMIKNEPQSASLDKTQPYGYGSIKTYVERVSAVTQKIIEGQKTS